MSSFNDYVKFVTQQFVTYVDRPKEERLAIKQQKKESRQPMQYQMFGLIPLAITMLIKRKRKSK